MILKYRDIETRIKSVSAVAGRYRLTKGKGDIITGDTGWFSNAITNNGLNDIADTQFGTLCSYCHVGTGTALENPTDTALGSFVASQDSIQSSTAAVEATPPYYASYVRVYRFNPGFSGTSPADVNISEVGISPQATTGDLFSRARVRDAASPQAPTTISVLGDEWLDVTYEFRLYPDHVLAGGSPDDGTGTITISGAGSPELFGYTIRPAYVTTSTYWAAATTRALLTSVSGSYGVAYESSSALGAVTSAPSGSFDALGTSTSSISAATYSADTYNRNVTLTVGLNDANVTGGVTCLMFYTSMGTYQVAFDSPVPKDNTKVWNYVTNLAWTRATI